MAADYVLGSAFLQRSPGVALREQELISERGFAPRIGIRGRLCDGAVVRGELLRWLNRLAGGHIWLGRGIDACPCAPRVAWAPDQVDLQIRQLLAAWLGITL